MDLNSPSVTSLAVSPDGIRIVTGHVGEAIVRDAATPARGTALDSGSSEVVAVSFSPSGERFVTLDADGHAIVWDASALAPMTRMSGPPSPGGGAAFSRDDSQLATTHEDGVRFWNPATCDLLHVILIPGRGSSSVAYRPDGTQVATGWSDGAIRLANASNGQVRHVLAPHSTGVHALVYSPDGVRLASGSRDGSIWLSDVETASPVLELRGHSGEIVSLDFSPDGTKLISGAEDSELRVWDTLPRRLRRRAAARLHDQREQLRPLVAGLFEQTPDPTLVS